MNPWQFTSLRSRVTNFVHIDGIFPNLGLHHHAVLPKSILRGPQLDTGTQQREWEPELNLGIPNVFGGKLKYPIVEPLSGLLLEEVMLHLQLFVHNVPQWANEFRKGRNVYFTALLILLGLFYTTVVLIFIIVFLKIIIIVSLGLSRNSFFIGVLHILTLVDFVRHIDPFRSNFLSGSLNRVNASSKSSIKLQLHLEWNDG